MNLTSEELEQLTAAVNRAAAGDYDQALSFPGELSDSFNQIMRTLKSQERKLDEISGRDFLTGIQNRLGFNQTTQTLWERGRSFVIAFIDIDGVKYCNDHFGHQEGDHYICQAVKALTAGLREGDRLYRIGGDEFVWLSLKHDPASLEELLEGIQARFVRQMERYAGYPCGFSFGSVAVDPKSGKTIHQYLTDADKRMFSFKLLHRQKKLALEDPNAMPEFSPGLESRVFEALSLTARNRYHYLCNVKTNMSRWSKNAVKDFNLPGEYIYDAGSVWCSCLHPDDREMYIKDIQKVFSGKKPFHNMEYRVLHRNGSYVVCTCQGYMMKDKNGTPELFAGTISNHGVIDNVDGVTNLYNIYEFMSAVRTLRNARIAVNFVIFGINQFHSINNAYGYGGGNQLLRSFAQKVSDLMRGRNMVYRLDGVKFVIILRENPLERSQGEVSTRKEAEQIVAQLREIARNGVALDNNQISLLLSCAVIHFENLELDESTLMSELNYGLVISKKDRDGELVYIDEALHGAAKEEMNLVHTIKQSVMNQCRGFYLAYQPQVDIHRNVIGVEALLRWRDDQWGVVSPGRFIPILEHDTCFYELGLWILRTALKETKELVEEYPDFRVSVNISYRQLEHHSFCTDVMETLSSLHFPPKNLTLELTEHCRSGNMELLKRDLGFFTSKGILIAADDFGTGYSSLSLLNELPFQCIKIDQRFVFGLEDNTPNQILVKFMISCAKEFHIMICVEGVETEDVLDFLKQYEPEYYQGYLFAKPCSLEEVRDMMRPAKE
ncbi:MAG: EAL domain-containing protein [Eubacteriales bacterium]|nr:EAL domain-containing protein [Eubacteriales bacterium]